MAVWVKICGIRDERTAEQVCQLHPDAIGLNFYSRSPRSVTPEVAARISNVVVDVQRVGLFVDQTAAQIEDLVGDCKLDAVQLHGDQSPEQIAGIAAKLTGIPIFFAWRMSGE